LEHVHRRLPLLVLTETISFSLHDNEHNGKTFETKKMLKCQKKV